jgi:hypothetical protein
LYLLSDPRRSHDRVVSIRYGGAAPFAGDAARLPRRPPVKLPKPERPRPTGKTTACDDIDTLKQLDAFNLPPRLSIPFIGAIDVEPSRAGVRWPGDGRSRR